MARRIEVSSTRLRLALCLLLVLIPPLLVVIWIDGEWRRHERSDAADEAVRWAGHAAALHGRMIDASRHWLEGVARTLAALPSDEARIRRVLEECLGQDARHVNVGVIDLQGTIVASGRPIAPAMNAAGRSHFRRALATRAFAIGDYETDPATGRSRLTFATPARDEAGRIHHVVFGIVEVDWLHQTVVESQFPKDTVVALIDGTGSILLHEPEPLRWAGRRLLESSGILADARPRPIQVSAVDGTRRLFGIRPVTTYPGELAVAVGIPEALATSRAEGLLTLMVIGFGTAILLGAVIAGVGTELYFLRPLGRIVHTAQRLQGGDLTARTGLPPRGDELHQLARTVDEMASALDQRERELRQQHEAMESQKRRYHALVENSADGVVMIGVDETIVYASPSTARISGYAIDELVGRSAFDLIHPDDRDRMRREFAAVVKVPASFRAGSFRLKHKSGTWRWIGAVASNMLGEPSVGAVVANYRDITDRLAAEEALRQAHEELEARVEDRTAALLKVNAALEAEIAGRARMEHALGKLSLAIEQTADCVMVADCNGIIEYVNPAFETLTGYSRDEAVGARTNIVKSGKHTPAFYDAMWRRIGAGEVFSATFINRKKDGQYFYEDQTITPIRDASGTVTHFVSTGRDITHRKRTEEALRRLNEQLEHEAKRIASALHDEAGGFLTTAHITLADVIRDVPPELAEQLRGVRRNLDQVEGQLRRLSHELRPRVLDDLGLLEALKFLIEGVSRRTGIDISIQASIEARFPPLVETALYRMVQEGLTNISKHAGASRATVILEEEDQKVRCSIRDDGRGFDVGALERPGERGLGLVGIQDRLEAVGGTLEIFAIPGGGTELRTAVPLEAT